VADDAACKCRERPPRVERMASGYLDVIDGHDRGRVGFDLTASRGPSSPRAPLARLLDRRAPNETQDVRRVAHDAGQQLLTGQQAEAYADHFVAVHVRAIGGGKRLRLRTAPAAHRAGQGAVRATGHVRADPPPSRRNQPNGMSGTRAAAVRTRQRDG